MERTEIAEIDGAYLLKRQKFDDDRGHFCELYREGSEPKCIQQNASFSFGGVLRGMHFQKNNPQGKLVTALYGEIWDVIYDLRKDSKTFQKGFGIRLSWKNLHGLYVPEGCAHGFITLSRYAVVHYNCTTFYDKDSDGGVNWMSPEIRQFFPEDIEPIVSLKDEALPTVEQYLLG